MIIHYEQIVSCLCRIASLFVVTLRRKYKQSNNKHDKYEASLRHAVMSFFMIVILRENDMIKKIEKLQTT